MPDSASLPQVPKRQPSMAEQQAAAAELLKQRKAAASQAQEGQPGRKRPRTVSTLLDSKAGTGAGQPARHPSPNTLLGTVGPKGLAKRPRSHPASKQTSALALVNSAAEERKMYQGRMDVEQNTTPKFAINSSAMTLKEFYNLLLSWDLVEEVRKQSSGEKEGTFEKIPDTFSGANEYIQAWRPMCLEELKVQLIKVLTDESPTAYAVALELKPQSNQGPRATLHCRVLPQKDLPPRDQVAMNQEVVLLVSDENTFRFALDAALEKRANFAGSAGSGAPLNYLLGLVITASNTGPKTRMSIEVLAQKWENHGRENMLLLKLGPMTAYLREFEALNCVEQCPLLPEILMGPKANRRTATNEDEMPDCPEQRNRSIQCIGDLGNGFVDWIHRRYNSSQQTAIVASATSEGFTLIKGPPGTGKTTTLVGLLNSLHIREYNRYYKQLVEIFEIPTSAHHYQNMWQSASKLKPHILVTAPSNVAVDNIILRIIEDGFVDGKGGRYNPPIIRVGSGQGDAVRAVSLQQNINSLLREDPKVIKQRLEILEREVKDIKKEVLFWQCKLIAMRSAVPQPLPPNWEARLNHDSNHPYYVNHKTQTTSWEFPPIEEYNQEGPHVSLGEMEEHIIPAGNLTRLLETLESKNLEIRRCNGALQAITDGASYHIKQLLEVSFLDKADVVFTTLNSAGSKCMDNCLKFEVVVVDEAAQAVEMATLVPLRMGSRHCVLVGDPQQLPATVMAMVGKSVRYERSLFERLETIGVPVTMLDTQYRMHPLISHFPRQVFYSGQLKDGENVSKKSYNKPFHKMPAFRPFVFYDLLASREEPAAGNSIKNIPEAEFALQLYGKLKEHYPEHVLGRRVGVITPYSGQLKVLRSKFRQIFGIASAEVELNTVDGFQGREMDIIIFSSVRSRVKGPNSIGFLADIRRMNVALTRAKYGLYVIGRCGALRNNNYWNDLISHAKERDSFRVIRDNGVNDFLSLCQVPVDEEKEEEEEENESLPLNEEPIDESEKEDGEDEPSPLEKDNQPNTKNSDIESKNNADSGEESRQKASSGDEQDKNQESIEKIKKKFCFEEDGELSEGEIVEYVPT